MRQESQTLEVAPLCACGCGLPVEYKRRGKWNQYIRTHQFRKARPLPQDCPFCGPTCAVGYGYCHCGCGAKIKPLKRAAITTHGTHLSVGWYREFVVNHHNRSRRIFTEEQARTIRTRFLAGETMRTLAESFGTNIPVIASLVSMRTYQSAGVDPDA